MMSAILLAAPALTVIKGGWSVNDTPPANVAAVARTPKPRADPTPTVDPSTDGVVPADSTLERARALARTARERLREGERGPALVAAREAARLRGGFPAYQVLLGDALAANRRHRAARRAWQAA